MVAPANIDHRSFVDRDFATGEPDSCTSTRKVVLNKAARVKAADTVRKAKIRALNDAFRQRLPNSTEGCRLIVTEGLGYLTIEQFADLLEAVSTYSDFTLDNDPHCEHDFGEVEQHGVRFLWEIQYFDEWMQYGSADPCNPSVTTRVMTLMLASEY